LISGNLAPFSAVVGFLVWVALPTGRLPGWWFAALAVPLWLWLVYRAWTLSATLTPDALVVRGLLSARRIPLADITAAGISSSWRDTWAPLIVTVQRRRHVIWAVQRNQYARPGRRLEADEAVDAIRGAAALPRLLTATTSPGRAPAYSPVTPECLPAPGR
jgi:hypothetical protein